MVIRCLLALCFYLGSFSICFSQTCPPNIDFENGDLSNWECFTGFTSVVGGKNVITLTPSLPIPGRHEIISPTATPEMDYYGNFPQLCPYGGGHSVKLGNDFTGAQAEGLSYTFTVPVLLDTFTFTYFYAVVFEDPNHNHYEQPRFFVTAYDVETGEIVNCASYDYVSGGGIPGFEVSKIRPGVLFKNWTPASLQFAGMKGRKVRLEFKTADCTLSGHFGYAYLDVGAACSNILATAPYCIETNSLILNAPYGFQTYTWYTQDFSAIVGNKQSITLSPPPAITGTYNVDVIPYPGYGCRDTFQAIVKPLPVPDTPTAKSILTLCQFQVTGALTAQPMSGSELFWYTSPTGGIGSRVAPIPPTSSPGTFIYYVSQKVLFGCESFRKKITVNVLPTPVASFQINNDRQCQNNNQFIFTSTSTNRYNSVFIWDFGNGKGHSSASDSIMRFTYDTIGNLTVKLKVVNGGTCSSEKSYPITLVPKPIAAFNHPAIVCEDQTPIAVIDKSTVPGGASAVNKWWWDFGGTILNTQNPNSFIAGDPGPLRIRQVVGTAEGCFSDTNITTLTVRYRPTASFSLGTPMCNNEILNFKNLSSLPSTASGESIVKWNWQLDTNVIFSVSDPSTYLTAGPYKVRLVVETNFGCRSIEVESPFQIHPKPGIVLQITDSCVQREIKYLANDSLSLANNWYWNFGNGFYKGNPSLSKSFLRKGDNPFTIIAETPKGCKDTLVRPFRIYDNIAFAGRDTIVAKDEPVQLNANGYPGTQYIWSPAAGLNDPHIANPVATLDRDQLYHMDAITQEGCDSHSKIFIKRYKGPDIYIPNAFTPNGDGSNDVLRPFAVGIKKFDVFIVYNRDGQVIFRTTEQNKGWDGTLNGRPLGSGTYVAVAHAVDYRGNRMVRKEAVVLIR